MGNKHERCCLFFFEPGDIATIKLRLRRTLVQHEFY